MQDGEETAYIDVSLNRCGSKKKSHRPLSFQMGMFISLGHLFFLLAILLSYMGGFIKIRGHFSHGNL